MRCRASRQQAHENVAVIGAGGIGSFVVAGASHRAQEGRVTAIDIDAGRLETAVALGADNAVDATGRDLGELLLDLSEGVGFDVVVEASGAPEAPAAALAGARRGGRVLLVGLHGAPRELDLTRTILREVDIFTTVAHVCDSDIPAALDLLAQSDVATVTAGPRIRLEALVEDGLQPLAERRAHGEDPRRAGLGLGMVVDVPNVASLLEARGARVAPDHEDRFVTRVLESVVVVCGHEHDFAGAELDVGVADARDAVTRDEVFELLRVRVPVDVVFRAGRKDCDAEDGVLRPDRCPA